MGPHHQRFRPSTERSVALGHIGQRGARSVDQLLAQILVAALADTQQLRLAAGGELPRNQTEPGGEIAAVVEAFRVADSGDERRCDDPQAGDCRQSAGVFVLPCPLDELGVESRDPAIEFVPLRASVGDEQDHAWNSTPLRPARP